jgi:hypothetical protein
VRLYRVAAAQFLNGIGVVDGNHDWVIKEKAGRCRPFIEGSRRRLI